jgi:hypothetical protein
LLRLIPLDQGQPDYVNGVGCSSDGACLWVDLNTGGEGCRGGRWWCSHGASWRGFIRDVPKPQRFPFDARYGRIACQCRFGASVHVGKRANLHTWVHVYGDGRANRRGRWGSRGHVPQSDSGEPFACHKRIATECRLGEFIHECERSDLHLGGNLHSERWFPHGNSWRGPLGHVS